MRPVFTTRHTALALLAACTASAVAGCGGTNQLNGNRSGFVVGANSVVVALQENLAEQERIAEEKLIEEEQAAAEAAAKKAKTNPPSKASLQAEIRASKPERSSLSGGRMLIRLHSTPGSGGVPLPQIASACAAYDMRHISHTNVVSYDLGVTYADILCQR